MIVLGVSHSVGGFSWEKNSAEERLVLAIEQHCGLSSLLAEILVSRGITLDEVNAFLNPTLKNHLPNPFSLLDMEKAAYRMADAIEKHEPIGLMGDYDVDGATSISVLKLFLEACRRCRRARYRSEALQKPVKVYLVDRRLGFCKGVFVFFKRKPVKF